MDVLTPVQAVCIAISVFNCVTGSVYAFRGDRRAGRGIAYSAAAGLVFLLTLTPVPRLLAMIALGFTIFGALLMVQTASTNDVDSGEDSPVTRRRP